MRIKLIVTSVFSLLGLTLSSYADPELDGYCPVSYVTMGKAVKGMEDIKLKRDGKTYLFSSTRARAQFMISAEKFLPAYSGYCAYGISLGKKIESDPAQFSVVGGVIYFNSSAVIKKKFDAEKKGFIQVANAKWVNLSKKS